jgi:hypothetical protein
MLRLGRVWLLLTVALVIPAVGTLAINLSWVNPADIAPSLACLIIAALACIAVAAALALFPRKHRWSLHQRDSYALLIGVALTMGGWGYGASYLGERTVDAFGVPPALTLRASGLDVHQSSRYARRVLETVASNHNTITLEATVISCDAPVRLTVAFWPRRKHGLKGRFVWAPDMGRARGDPFERSGALVGVRSGDATIADPEDGGDQEVSGRDPAVKAEPVGGNASAMQMAVARRTRVTRRRPLVANFDADWLVRRNVRSCYLKLPAITGNLSEARGGRHTVQRFIQVVGTSGGVHVLSSDSNPQPQSSSTGQSAWPCDIGVHNDCVLPVAVIEEAGAQAKLNLTLLVLGAVIGLGLSTLIQVALVKLGVITHSEGH